MSGSSESESITVGMEITKMDIREESIGVEESDLTLSEISVK
jgi:hypothetical protein